MSSRPTPMHSLRGALIVGLAIAAMAFLFFFFVCGHARAHDAKPTAAMPQGWSYPFSCCSGLDCREVPASSIGEPTRERNGYTIKATTEFITNGDKRIKDSPDGEFHWCSVAGANDGRTICLFVPPRNM